MTAAPSSCPERIFCTISASSPACPFHWKSSWSSPFVSSETSFAHFLNSLPQGESCGASVAIFDAGLAERRDRAAQDEGLDRQDRQNAPGHRDLRNWLLENAASATVST